MSSKFSFQKLSKIGRNPLDAVFEKVSIILDIVNKYEQFHFFATLIDKNRANKIGSFESLNMLHNYAYFLVEPN